MANSLLTINMITREAIRLWRNTNSFLQHLEMQYDDQFARTGAKIGTSLRIRLPNDFVVGTGAAITPQDTNEQSTTLVLATQKNVPVTFSSLDKTMSMDDFSRRILAPMINNLTGEVAADVMSGAEGGVSNFVSNVDGTGAIISPTSETWLTAGAILGKMSSPNGNRKIIMDLLTQARTVSSLSGLFNPQAKISQQYRTGQMAADTLGFDWFGDQTTINHTSGTFTAGTVNGAGQSGTVLTTNAITGTLTKGDIITIAGVNSVNRITKVSDGTLAQFVVTVAAASGATSLTIYPAIVPPNGGAKVQYQTVDASPANAAAISLVSPASSVYKKNIAFCPDAVTMATADLEMPTKGVEESAREVFDGISMRMISAYNIGSDQFITRLDVLYGYLWIRPEWAVAVADRV